MRRHSSFIAIAFAFSVGAVSSATSYGTQPATEIKALSEQEVGDYLAGKGMGFAKAAELNGYPGPAHVLALAADLQLSPEQRTRTETLQAQMHSRAVAAGRALIDAEQTLDRLFASKTVTAERLQEAVRQIAERQAQVRLVHLEAHLAQAAILTPSQVAKYYTLRGHAGATHEHRAHGS